jgi:hypothetical protein
MRAYLLLLLASSLVAGCATKRCADGTLLVSVSLDATSGAADTLAVDIGIDGTSTTNTVKHTPSSSSGTIIVQFPHGYPSGKSVTITVIASAAGSVVGAGATQLTPASGCDVATVSVTAGGVDGGAGDGPIQGDIAPDLRTVCPSGQQDNDGDGVCMPDCTTAPIICNATHQSCSDATGTAMCVCNPGYALSGSSCVWQEVPADPTFQNMPAGSWTLQNGAAINPTAPGLTDPGNLVLSKNSYCPASGPPGGATQKATIPTFAASEPLALQVTTELDCSTAGPPCSATYAAAVQLNGGVVSVPYTPALTKQLVCLGERAYGGPLNIAVRPNDHTFCTEGPTTLQLLVDHLGIVSAPTCPAPATIPDANFEAATNTWTFTPGGGTAALGAGLGVSGTAAGHIATTAGCQGPLMTNLTSFPFMSMPGAALTFSFKGTAAKPLELGDASPTPGVNWAELTGDGSGTFSTQTVCIPEYVKGMVMPLRFSTATGNQCAPADVRDFLVDNLAFVSSVATCPATANILDGGFEQTTAVRSYWPISINANGTTGQISAAPVTDAANAHAGNQVLKMSISQNCTSATAETTITVPPPMGANGPAVHFFYKMSVSSPNAAFTVASGPNSVVAASATTYNEKVLCLDPGQVGQGVPLTVTVTSTSGVCANTFAQVIGYFDDFDVSTDAACALP